MITPSANPITTGYGKIPGYTVNGGIHRGIDFAHSPDRYVYAPEDGRVICVAWDRKSQEGNAIYLTAGNRRHLLGHLSQFLVGNGAVKKGQRLAIMGQTGLAFGVHLHWGLTVDGVLVNPLNYVDEGADMKPQIQQVPVIVDERTARSILYLNGWTDQDIANANPIPSMIGQDIVHWTEQYVQKAPDDNPFRHNIAKVIAYDNDVKAAADSTGFKKVQGDVYVKS